MNLNDLKKNTSSKIYDRGVDYYKEGCISSLQNTGSGKWSAKVEGSSNDYTVDIKLDDKHNIKKWHCNCPYDGAICKHVVAVLLSIKEKSTNSNPIQKSKQKAPEWETIIESTPERQLRDFLLNYARKQTDFQDELIINLSKSLKKIDIGKYQKIINRSFNNMAGRHGYIEYDHTYAALHPVNNLIEKAEEYLTKGNLQEAFSIAAAVAPECIEALQYMDDSDGECGSTINEAFEMIDKILHVCNDPQLTDTIFEWLHEQMQNKDYDDYGCADELEPIFFHWANTPSRLKIAYQFIDQQLKKNSNLDDRSAQYQTTNYLKYKTVLLEREGKNEEAEQLVNKNIHLSDFRKIKIEQALTIKDYQAAIKHLNEGIAQAKKNELSGTAHQFKDQLLDIYKKQNDQINIRKISHELYFENRGTIEYYRTYKGTFAPDEWKNEQEAIIKKLSSKKGKSFWGYMFQSDLAAIYVEEQMWDRLLNEVKQADRIEITETYSKYLKETYPEELIVLYKNSILKYAENTGRNIYADIVRYLKNMTKLKGGLNEAKMLKEQLLEQYKNRPAMKNEFKKLNW